MITKQKKSICVFKCCAFNKINSYLFLKKVIEPFVLLPNLVSTLNRSAGFKVLTGELARAAVNGNTVSIVIERLVCRTATAFSADGRLNTAWVIGNVGTSPSTFVRANLILLSTHAWDIYIKTNLL